MFGQFEKGQGLAGDGARGDLRTLPLEGVLPEHLPRLIQLAAGTHLGESLLGQPREVLLQGGLGTVAEDDTVEALGLSRAEGHLVFSADAAGALQLSGAVVDAEREQA
ncbi:hypothetical protein [Hyalangium sp.]|uniref:hypothetical protein n=1 Tax=Hyalangium sp. TaxID=2028555 RepID=UPI003899B388